MEKQLEQIREIGDGQRANGNHGCGNWPWVDEAVRKHDNRIADCVSVDGNESRAVTGDCIESGCSVEM